MNILELDMIQAMGGAETYLLRLSQFLRKEGHQVFMGARVGSCVEKMMREEGFASVALPSRGKLDLRSLFWLWKYIKMHRIEVIHTHLSHANRLGYAVGRLARIPVAAHSHSLDSHRSYVRLHYIAAVASAVRDHLTKGGISPQKISVLFNGVNLEDFPLRQRAERVDARVAFGLGQQDLALAVVANFRSRKGHRFLLEAMAQLSQSRPELSPRLHAFFAGSGDQEARLRTQVAALHLTKQVHFLGYSSQIGKLLAASDAFVLPSNQEGLFIAVTEAMARGVPVISTDVAGMPEVVIDGVTGLLVPPEDSGALALAILQLFEKEDRESMVIRARKHIETHFDDIHCLKRCELWLQAIVRAWPRVLTGDEIIKVLPILGIFLCFGDFAIAGVL